MAFKDENMYVYSDNERTGREDDVYHQLVATTAA